jgi:hypothetical protein
VIGIALLLAGNWAVHAGGGWTAAAPDFEARASFVEYAEAGDVATRQRPRSGGGFEAGLARLPPGRLGFAVTVARGRRDAPGSFTARLPHPLYLDRHRVAEGPIDGAARTETAVHMSLAWSRPVGGVTLTLAGGPSYVVADADLVEGLTHDDEYPYDSVRVTAVRTSSARGDALGGHLAAGLERRVSSRLAMDGGVRWSRARVRLAEGSGHESREADVTMGGLTARLALRLYF